MFKIMFIFVQQYFYSIVYELYVRVPKMTKLDKKILALFNLKNIVIFFTKLTLLLKNKKDK